MRIEHIRNFSIIDGKRDLGPFKARLVPRPRQVVAVKRYVHVPGGYVHSLDGADLFPDELRQRDAAGHDPDQDQFLRPLVLLQDLMRKAGEDPLHPLGVQYYLPARLFHRATPSLIGRDRDLGQKKTSPRFGEATCSSVLFHFHPLLTSRD